MKNDSFDGDEEADESEGEPMALQAFESALGMEMEMEGMAKTVGSESGAVGRGAGIGMIHWDVL